MEEKSISQINRYIRISITLVTLAAVLYLLWYFRAIAIYILLGVVLSLIARPLYVVLEKIHFGRFKIPNPISAIVSLLAIWAVVFAFFSVLVPLLINEGYKLSKLNPDTVLKELEYPVNRTVNFLEKYGVLNFVDTTNQNYWLEREEKTIVIEAKRDSLNPDSVYYVTLDTISQKSILPYLKQKNDSTQNTGIRHREQLEHLLLGLLQKFFNFTKVGNIFESVFSIFTSIFTIIFVSTFIAFFFLRDKNLFYNMVLGVIPEKYEKQTVIILHDSRHLLSRYFIGLCIQILLIMTCVTIGLVIIGFNFKTALIISFIYGFFNIIPFLGPVIGGIIGLVLGLTNNIDLDYATQIMPLLSKMVIVYAIVQIIDNVLFQPLIFSNSVNAHPLEILLIIIIAGSIAGVSGMIFAVPTYTFLRIIARQFLTNFKVVRTLTKNL